MIGESRGGAAQLSLVRFFFPVMDQNQMTSRHRFVRDLHGKKSDPGNEEV